ncbi:hypothetical protein A0U90_08495 [Kozakia baliensis]|nr:hypothetical protein A0U90_08495 [Kozakia baliensis]
MPERIGLRVLLFGAGVTTVLFPAFGFSGRIAAWMTVQNGAFGLSAVIFGACLLFVAVRRTAPVVVRRGSLGARVSAAPDWALEEDGRTG